ncbi:MAG: hypothetical protein GY778_13620 [bacterium]|nr:hypothetical protein [bacterium]
MGDLLQKGAARLATVLKANAGGSVTYSRGGDSVVLTAGVGRSEFAWLDDAGATIEEEARDYLVIAAELILAAAATLPAAGDKIVEVAGGTTYTYQVMAFGDEPPYRYSDQQRVRLRIHTKLIGSAAA